MSSERSAYRAIGNNSMQAKMLGLVVGLLLVTPRIALAYHPDTGHAPLLRLAISQYQHCTPNSRLVVDHRAARVAKSTEQSDAASRLLQGNVAMDHGLGFSLSGEGLRDWWGLEHDDALRLPKRLLHWHFYNPDQKR